MSDPNPRFAMMRADLRAMAIDERAETIVAMWKLAASEWASMVIEHVAMPPGHPPRPAVFDDNPIRAQLRDLDLDARCDFLGELFTEICNEFAALVADRKERLQ